MDEFGFPYAIQSNASLKLFPGNHASRFTVQLAERMVFEGNWVVGITDFYFPLSFVLPHYGDENHESNEIRQKLKRTAGELSSVDTEQKIKRINDGEGPKDLFLVMDNNNGEPITRFYNPGDVVIQKNPDIVSAMSDMSEIYKAKIEETKNKYRKDYEGWQSENIKLLDSLNQCETEKTTEFEKCNTQIEKLIAQQQEAQEVIQVKETQLTNARNRSQYWKDNFVSLAHLAYKDANQMNNQHIPKYLYVYCDIAKMQQVGDTYANFLHIAHVPPIRMNGQTARDRCDFPRYTSLGKHSFDRIGIVIRDEKGNVVNFEKGSITIIRLHFKKIRA
jgi:hypothetical protein